MKRILLPLALAAAITVPVGAQFGWFSLNGGLIARMSSAVPAATIEQAGTGPILSLIRRGIGAVSTDGGVLRNTTAAAAGAQQYSPRSCWEGQGWKTDATAGSQSVVFCMETQPVQGSAAPSGNFILKASINGGAFSTVGTFTSAGQLNIGTVESSGNGLFASGTVQTNGDAGIEFPGRARLRAPSSGVLRVLNPNADNTYDITLADWGTLLSGETISVADNGVVAITGGANLSGILYVTNLSDTRGCAFQIRGASNSVDEITAFDIGGFCTTTAGTATSINVYWDAGDSRYEIQNTRGGTRDLKLILIGGS